MASPQCWSRSGKVLTAAPQGHWGLHLLAKNTPLRLGREQTLQPIPPVLLGATLPRGKGRHPEETLASSPSGNRQEAVQLLQHCLVDMEQSRCFTQDPRFACTIEEGWELPRNLQAGTLCLRGQGTQLQACVSEKQLCWNTLDGARAV